MCNFQKLNSKDNYKNLQLRSKMVFEVYKYFHANSFVNISTPLLSFPTKEYSDGEFIVFSNINPGYCFSLPHSPQLYKQYIIASMKGYVNKYFQIAKNFRPEIGDITHAQEFEQIDFEISDAEVDDIILTIKGVFSIIFKMIDINPEYVNLTYNDAMNKYGSDSPDLRYSKGLIEVCDDLLLFKIKDSDFNVEVFNEKIILPEHISYQKQDGDNVFSLIKKEAGVEVLGDFRNLLIKFDVVKKEKDWSFVLLYDLPLFVKKNGILKTFHHPQACPQKKCSEIKKMTEDELLFVNTKSCDFIVNGIEVAGGNVRISDYELQKEILTLIDTSEYDFNFTYKPLLALLSKYNDYKSGGAAIGLDRLTMLISGGSSLQDVQAFGMSIECKEFFGGPFLFERNKFMGYGIELEDVFITESKIEVFQMKNIIKNFIHGIDHIKNVEKNIYTLVKNKKFNHNKLSALILATHWHDIGRDDYCEELVPHQELSVVAFKKWSINKDIDDVILNDVINIINNHRNREALNDQMVDLFWDADKLDILNIKRCKSIISEYKKNTSYKRINKFNLLDTVFFWKTLDASFMDSFRTKKGRELANKLYPEFKNYVDLVYEEEIKSSKKLIGIGGGEHIKGSFRFLDEMLFNLLGVKKILYMPIGTFNNECLIAEFESYIQEVKLYYSEIDSAVQFEYINPIMSSEEIVKKINSTDLLYISGGDTEYLVDRLSDIKIKDALFEFYNNKKCIIGNSAGILALLKRGLSCYGGELKKYTGLGLIHDEVCVHCDGVTCDSSFDDSRFHLKEGDVFISMEK